MIGFSYLAWILPSVLAISLHFIFHNKGKRLIRQWARRNKIKILRMKYKPVAFCWAILSGFHPANFTLWVREKNKRTRTIQIMVGGFFPYFSDRLVIRNQ